MKLRVHIRATAATILAGAVLMTYPGAALAAPSPGSSKPDRAAHGSVQPYGLAQLQRDVAAIRSTGVTGVLAEVDDGRLATRSGQARLGSSLAVPYDSYFRIGSATKTFVATVVLQLVAEGRVSLDDTVAKWLPGVVSGNGNNGSIITIRELLQHTSGIYSYSDDLPLVATASGYYEQRFSPVAASQLVAIAMRHEPLFKPGTNWSYSNTDYVLLGMIIQKVTGRSWQQEVTDRIIVPLGLRHTLAPGTWPYLPSPHPDGYEQFTAAGPLIDTTSADPAWAGAAGGMISTASDLDQFIRALVTGRLLPAAELKQMETTVPAPGVVPGLPGIRYGLGLMWIPLSCGGGYWTHPGDFLGYSTWDGVTPDGRDTAVVMASTETGGQPALQQHLDEAALVDDALCAGTRH